MLKYFEISLALLLILSLACIISSISLNPKNFCKSIEKKCFKGNALPIVQCDQGICTRNKTECKEYFRLKNKFQDNRLKSAVRIALMSHFARNRDELEKFKKFQNKIKDCSQSVYKQQLNDVCVSSDKEQTKHFIYSIFVHSMQINCPKKQPYTCGSRLCSLNKEACYSFIYKNKNYTNSTARMLGIKKCDLI